MWLNIWEGIKQAIELLRDVAGIALVIGLFFSYKQLSTVKEQLRTVKKDYQTKNKRAAVEKSIEYLNYFANSFLPEAQRYRDKVQEILKADSWIEQSDSFSGKFDDTMDKLGKMESVILIVKQECGILNLINELEFFSAAIVNGVTDEDIVYTPIARVFCKFIEDEHIVISLLKQTAPYENLFKLYKKWKDRQEVEKLELQKRDAEIKIREKGTGYMSSPSIGM